MATPTRNTIVVASPRRRPSRCTRSTAGLSMMANRPEITSSSRIRRSSHTSSSVSSVTSTSPTVTTIVRTGTGTDGKTTTTALLAAALGTAGSVVTNDSGANLPYGLVAALTADLTAGTAVLEVDEGALPAVVAATRPAVVVLLNLSRDQLDRYG